MSTARTAINAAQPPAAPARDRPLQSAATFWVAAALTAVALLPALLLPVRHFAIQNRP